jgi:hypothetical protein
VPGVDLVDRRRRSGKSGLSPLDRLIEERFLRQDGGRRGMQPVRRRAQAAHLDRPDGARMRGDTRRRSKTVPSAGILHNTNEEELSYAETKEGMPKNWRK